MWEIKGVEGERECICIAIGGRYVSKKMIIKEYIGHIDLPLNSPFDPVDSYLNILLSLDKKGLSNIYKIMLGKNRNILAEKIYPIQNSTSKILYKQYSSLNWNQRF